MKVLIRLLPLIFLLAFQPICAAGQGWGKTSCVDAGDEAHHALIFQNSSVRILELQLGWTKATDAHCHQNSFLSIVTSASSTSDGTVSTDWAPGEARFTFGPVTQTIRNLEAVTHHAIEVETLRTVPYTWYRRNPNIDLFGGDMGNVKPTWSVSFTQGGLTATRIQLASGDSWEVNAPDHILIALTSLELQKQAPGKPDATITLEPGETLILPGGSVSKLTNKGRDGARFVTVEF